MNKKNIIIMLSIFIVFIVIFLTWKFIIGFKLSTESELKNVIKNISDISMYIIDNDEQMLKIDNGEDINEILNILGTSKVKKSTDLWVGGAYRLSFVNNKTNDVVKVVIHPNQITISDKLFVFCNTSDNIYQKVEDILKKYIVNLNKFKN